MEFKDRFLQQK